MHLKHILLRSVGSSTHQQSSNPDSFRSHPLFFCKADDHGILRQADSRTGIAVCGKSELIASPVTVIQEKNFEKCIEKTAIIAKEQHAEEIVVGYPKNMQKSGFGHPDFMQKRSARLRFVLILRLYQAIHQSFSLRSGWRFRL